MSDPRADVAALTRELLREGVSLAGALGLEGMHATDRRALALLDELGAQDRASPSALAEGLGLTRGATTTVVDRLCAAGLVERRASAADRRRVELLLTDRARQLGADHLRPWAMRIAAAAAALSLEEAGLVRDFLVVVLDRADDEADTVDAEHRGS